MLIFPAFSISAQTASEKPGFFIAPRTDFSFYGRHEPTLGGGLCTGYDGSKIAAFGINAVYIFPLSFGSSSAKEERQVNALELTVFARQYIYRWRDDSLISTGPFFQFNAGAILFFFENEIFKTFDYITGCFGLTLGWRISLGNRFYAEPAFRLGFPYGAAAELAIGIRF